jgi:hypothetical protein
MNDRERLTLDQTQGNPPLLTVILSVIDPGQHVAFKNQGRIQEIDTTLLFDLLPLVLVPFKLHSSKSSSIYKSLSPEAPYTIRMPC